MENMQNETQGKKMIVKTVIREDGSYGTEMVEQSSSNYQQNLKDNQEQFNKPLRNALVAETPDSYLASLLSVSITKILLKKKQEEEEVKK